jgi:DNA-directed RNA polymerase specialized sigma24 family protein
MKTANKNSSIPVLHLVVSPLAEQPFDLDEDIARAFDGDRDAMHAVARELHPRLVHEARQLLGELELEADDVVQDLLVGVLEGRVRPPRGRGEGVAHLLRMTGVFARKHARNVRRFRSLE